MRQIDAYFNRLEKERILFYEDMGISPNEAWRQPWPGKWSVGETVYHLYLLARLLRKTSAVYIPIAMPMAYIRRKKPYVSTIHDIYKTYKKEKGKSMPAPSALVPHAGLKDKYNFTEVQNLLDVETGRLKRQLANISDDVAGHIRFPDPVANFPNVIQSVQLLGIHEKHHFDIVKAYEYS